MIVLDASVLIAHFKLTDAHHARAGQILVDTAAQSLLASPVTLAEVLVEPARHGVLDAVHAELRELGVQSVALPIDAHVQLAELRAHTGLKLPDCCVLLTAEQTGAAVGTFDERLAAAARGRGIQVH